MDPRGESLPVLDGSELWRVRRREDIFVVTGPGVKATLPVQYVEVPFRGGGDGDFDMPVLLRELRARGLHSLFVEAGAHTASAFLAAGLVDRLYLFLAPKLLGRGLGWTSGMRLEKLEQAVRLKQVSIRPVGADFLLSARTYFQ
ncbi:MAG: hypothetical protein HC902_06900 [Calothrix sp. SM1_5_4]|nr:hypothetical protein [Calothrix sp. SM1_5_4]